MLVWAIMQEKKQAFHGELASEVDWGLLNLLEWAIIQEIIPVHIYFIKKRSVIRHIDYVFTGSNPKTTSRGRDLGETEAGR